jgi:hypothetical protein
MPLGGIFSRPTSVILFGSNRPLLNWVAYALASETDPGFIWTDVRLWGEVLADVDPLARNLVPPNRLAVVYPNALVPNDAAANMAIGGVVRGDEPSDTVRQLVDFLRLPLPTQRLLSGATSGGQPIVLVLSNAHRIVAFYPVETVASVIQAIVGAGVTLFETFADAPLEGREAFETILHVEGNDPKEWRQATLRVEKGTSAGPLRTGSKYRLGELDPVAAVLTRDLK